MLVSDESLEGQIRYWQDAPGENGQEVLALLRELQRRRALDARPVAVTVPDEHLMAGVFSRLQDGLTLTSEQSGWVEGWFRELIACRACAAQPGEGLDLEGLEHCAWLMRETAYNAEADLLDTHIAALRAGGVQKCPCGDPPYPACSWCHGSGRVVVLPLAKPTEGVENDG